MSKSSAPTSSDPWETPPTQLDPELVETSKRLMAKSSGSEPAALAKNVTDKTTATPEDSTDPKDIQIAQLEQQKQRLFQRNVFLVTETTRLRVENQHLLQQLSELKQSSSWLTRLFKRLRQPQ